MGNKNLNTSTSSSEMEKTNTIRLINTILQEGTSKVIAEQEISGINPPPPVFESDCFTDNVDYNGNDKVSADDLTNRRRVVSSRSIDECGIANDSDVCTRLDVNCLTQLHAYLTKYKQFVYKNKENIFLLFSIPIVDDYELV